MRGQWCFLRRVASRSVAKVVVEILVSKSVVGIGVVRLPLLEPFSIEIPPPLKPWVLEIVVSLGLWMPVDDTMNKIFTDCRALLVGFPIKIRVVTSSEPTASFRLMHVSKHRL